MPSETEPLENQYVLSFVGQSGAGCGTLSCGEMPTLLELG